jgi:Protein of unknown function (DUF2892)
VENAPESPNSFANGEQNLTTTERAVYIVAGLGLAAASLKPRPNPLLSALALLGGSFLAWRGYLGNCPIKAALIGSGPSRRQITRQS